MGKSIEWHDILMQLIEINCLGNLAGVIRSHLKDRKILMNWSNGHDQRKGCPQGSCFRQVLFLPIANFMIKEMLKPGFLIYAFADDFCLILSDFRLLDGNSN